MQSTRSCRKDALHKHLTEYFFGTNIRAQETYRNLTVRLETAYARLKEHGVELPEEVRGWFLLRKLQLEANAEAMVLTHTKGALSYKEVTTAVTAIFPQGAAKVSGGKSREVFEAIAEEGEDESFDGEESNDVFQAVADQIQSQEEYDEEDAIEVFETYQDIRKKMQQRKMGRGYRQQGAGPSRWTLTGTVRGKIEQLKAKSRCHLCQEVGHWKRECPKKKGTASTGGKSSRSSDAMVTDQGGELVESGLGQELFIQEEDIDNLEIFLAEQDGRIDVVLADPREHEAGEDDVRGDLESRIFEFFKKEQDQSAAEDAYMADLATHGVPDTACRRTLIGESVLSRMSEVLGKAGLGVKVVDEENEFKFGNAGVMRTCKSAIIPVRLGKKQLAIKAAVLPGSGSGTPLLMSKELLRGLKATLDMENHVLVVRRCGVQMKLRETERGHYAIPLFEGMGVMTEPDVIQQMQVKTHEANAVEGFGSPGAQVDPPSVCQEQHELHGRRHQHGSASGSLHKDSLDRELAAGSNAASGNGTAGVASSDSGSVVRQGRRRARRARARAKRKDDLQHRQVPEGRESSQLRTCLCSRQGLCDLGQEVHQGWQPGDREDDTSHHVSVSLVRGAEGPAKVGEGVVGHHAGATDGEREGTLATKDDEFKGTDAKGQGEGKDEALHDGQFEPSVSRLSAGAGGVDPDSDRGSGRAKPDGAQTPEAFAADRDDDARAGALERRGDLKPDEEGGPRRMSKGEKQLCRRGLQNCKIPEERQGADAHGVDILYLEAGVELSIATAAGLTTDCIFSEGEVCARMMGSAETVQKALQKIRRCQPLMLVIRTPEHMTLTRGSRGLCRTYTTKQRCAFTRLVAARCAEQLCDGRLFTVYMENESVKSGVRAWFKVMTDVCMNTVQLGDSDVSQTCVYTNSKEVQGRLTMGWPHVQRRDDESWFGKDVAVAVMERKKAKYDVMAAHCVFTIDTLRDEGDESERKIVSVLRKCHENLGHPSPARFVMLLKSAHASERVLKLARGLECETCGALSKPKSHNVVKMRRATEFNQQICVDTFELDVRYSKIHFLNIVDEATGFQLCAPLWKGMQAKHVRNTYRKTWKRWAGAPIRLFSDGGKEFEGEFEHGLSLDGTYGDVSAAYAPWQNGLVERKGDVWKTAFAKAHLETQPRNKQEVQELVEQVNNAVNSMSRVEGFSPYQHVFGRDVRVPGMITTDYDTVINSSLVEGESVFERRMELRRAARRAFVDADAENKIRKALEHRTRPDRGPFEAGQLVFFWRKSRFESKCHWHGPAVVIGKSGQSKVWVAKGTKVYRCCPEQLRRLSPEQEATIRMLPADMVYVRNEVSARGAGNFYDLSVLERPPVAAEGAENMQDIVRESQRVEGVAHGLLEGGEQHDEEMPHVEVLTEMPSVPVARIAREREAPQENEDGAESPAKRLRSATQGEPQLSQLNQALRNSAELLDRGASASSGARGAAADAAAIPVPEDTLDEELEVTLSSGYDRWLVDHGRSKLVRIHEVERNGRFRVEGRGSTCESM